MASLKSFIKSVRKAKTIADERSAVMKESAAIRTSFRDASLDQTTRRINISKLLYLYIMGEKTHFGQVECLKLLASPRFADKRLGYLATMLLLDENQEVLTLLTNSLDNDMQHPNAFVVGLALCCLGNIASPELARDLYTNVDKLMNSSNTYLKKKAVIVAAKLVEKDPDLAEIFLPKINQLVSDKHPNMILSTSRLIQALYTVPECRPTLIKTIPKIIAQLKRITTSGYMPDYDVMGITDPFSQVYLLTTLRTLAVDENCPSDYLEEINDTLTQVSSNLDSGKNAAHAILYECVKTIFAIQSDQSLKILGVNILGKFLSTKDNNTRYVALDTLLTVIDIEPLAVQRHRSTIVNCLADGDISIRRRALELSFAILNEQNIRVLVREILLFLENCTDNELKPFITSQLTIAANKYAPNDKWHFDTLIRMLNVSGNFITSDILSSILALILQCNNQELKKHIVSKLYQSYLEDSTQYGLSLITIWCLGEYADLIMNDSIEVNGKSQTVTESSIIKILKELIDNSTYSEQETIQLVTYILTAIIKLSVKFKDSNSIESLRLILNSKTYDTNLEIQIRAVEYQEIFAQDYKLKSGLLSKMPAPPVKERESLSLQGGRNNKSKVKGINISNSGSTTTNDLLDLIDDSSNQTSQAQPASSNNNGVDLLSDIFSSGPTPSNNDTSNRNNDILSLFNSNVSAPASGTATPQPEPIKNDGNEKIDAFNNEDINISFIPKSFPQNGQAIIEAIVSSKNNSQSISQFQLLFAVPKSQKLSISSTSGGDSLTGDGATIKQVLKITGKQGAKIKLRVKIQYNVSGKVVEDMFDFGEFVSKL